MLSLRAVSVGMIAAMALGWAGIPVEGARRVVAAASVASSVEIPGVVTSITGASSAVPLGAVTVTGHGQGHGRGMSQYGALGYSLMGQTYGAILRHYYGGTTLSRTSRAASTTLLTVRLTARDNLDLKVTVPKGSFTVAGAVHFAAGQAVTLRARPDGWIDVYKSVGCAGVSKRISIIRGTSGVIVPDRPAGNDVGKMLTLCVSGSNPAYRGRIVFLPRADGTRPSTTVRRTVNLVRLDDYLRGVVPRESIASWGDAGGGKGLEALKVQAVAARTYALAENRAGYAKTCDTTSCQVYGGAGRNGVRIEDSRTDGAVYATTGQVMLKPGGAFAYAEFGASSGGRTAGGQFPPVVDLGDATPSNPYHNWSMVKDLRVLGPRFGVGTLKSAVVTSRDGRGADGGRVRAVLLTGTTGKKVTISGDDVRRTLGLYSNWFVLHTG